ncbi:hypothetical protein L484_004400 [Morus notabilis]|uniref:Uncharacterized protein n=1 Tax=Morus notabilis TaxID=981085 RepID=W9RTU5_9ROSA|nr:hypothetical protein L484_004400 [Morus notabilis]
MRAPHSFSFCDSVTVASEASGMSVFLSRQTGRNQALISSCRKIVFIILIYFPLKDGKGVDTSYPHRKLTIFHALPVDARTAITLAAGGEWLSETLDVFFDGEASVDCVRTKYESKGRGRKGLVNGDINSSGNQ